MRLNFITPSLAVIFAALAQEYRLLEFWGVNPNLTVIALALAAFSLEDFTDFFPTALAAAIFSKTAPIWEVAPLAIFLVAAVLWISKKAGPWNIHIGFLVSLFVATTIFYVTIDRAFILDRGSLFLSELAYNLIIGAALWLAINYFTNGISRRLKF